MAGTLPIPEAIPMFELGAIKFDVEVFTSDARMPEERLMFALLEDALTTFERGLHSRNPIVRQQSCEVDEWMRSRSNEHVFSFENVCETLGLDPDYLRAGLSALKREVRTTTLFESIRKRYPRRTTAHRAWKGRIG
jgi:hypothetical protein